MGWKSFKSDSKIGDTSTMLVVHVSKQVSTFNEACMGNFFSTKCLFLLLLIIHNESTQWPLPSIHNLLPNIAFLFITSLSMTLRHLFIRNIAPAPIILPSLISHRARLSIVTIYQTCLRKELFSQLITKRIARFGHLCSTPTQFEM